LGGTLAAVRVNPAKTEYRPTGGTPQQGVQSTARWAVLRVGDPRNLPEALLNNSAYASAIVMRATQKGKKTNHHIQCPHVAQCTRHFARICLQQFKQVISWSIRLISSKLN
jgi:hypothetical protein